jgi:hypothetical protein
VSELIVKQSALAIMIEANPKDGLSEACDGEELRDILFNTLADLRAGRITVQEANAVTTAATKMLCGTQKFQSTIPPK